MKRLTQLSSALLLVNLWSAQALADTTPDATPTTAATTEPTPAIATATEAATTTATTSTPPAPTAFAAPAATTPAARVAPVNPEPRAQRVRATPADAAPEPEYDRSGLPSSFSVLGVIDNRWNTSNAFDLYNEDDVTTFLGLALAYDVARLSEQFALAVEAGWNMGSTDRDGTLGGTLGRAELTTHNTHLALVARYDLLPFLAPHARLSAGLSFVDMALQSPGDNTTFEDHAVAPFLGIGLGASLQTPPGLLATRRGHLRSAQVGVRFEVGYTFSGDVGFSLDGDNNVRVPVGETSLGSLPRSGAYIHTALFARL